MLDKYEIGRDKAYVRPVVGSIGNYRLDIPIVR